MTTFGTHNLHDHDGEPTPFADIIFFTEAIPRRVRRALKPHGYVIAVCPWQRDLVIAWRRGVFIPDRNKLGRIKKRYVPAHPGIPLVTPHRGTFWINGSLADDAVKTTLLDEHRINAAFPPFKRGEPKLRPRFWRLHTRITLRVIRRRERLGALVLAGGDTNTPRGVSAYQGVLHEGGDHFDRVGSTQPLEDVEYLSRKGSDHPRLRARRAANRKEKS